MPINEPRILPPLAIARLGASSVPLAAYSLALPEENPLDFRQIVPEETLEIDPATGEVSCAKAHKNIRFLDDEGIRPVAPFLEVWAVTGEKEMEPLTLDLLASEGLGLGEISWTIEVANHKVFRRTTKDEARVTAKLTNLTDHQVHPLLGRCPNFLPGKTLPFGSVRFIKPTKEFPEIRLRFTPAAGLVYGAIDQRHTSNTETEPDPVLAPERIIYDPQKSWLGFREPNVPTVTNPGQIYAGYLDNNTQVSWGYLDDSCDGSVTVYLKCKSGPEPLEARALISSGPPTFVPDALPIRTVTDDLLQIALGPEVNPDEEVPIETALEIVRRSFDTIRQLNTAVMNGNPVNGRLRAASTMVAQDSNDFDRQYAPIMAASLVDQAAVRTLHERVFTALTTGSAPWFADVLRRPEEIGDLSDKGRRKMPAMMRGADGRMLCLTRRQINQIVRAASSALFQGSAKAPSHP
jgi:hypothetical protein